MIVTVSGQLKPATAIDLRCFSGGSSAKIRIVLPISENVVPL